MAGGQLWLLLLVVLPATLAWLQPRSRQHRATAVDGDVGEKLILTNYLQQGRIEEARNLSRVTGGPFPENIPSYSGYFTVRPEYDSNMFFWFFPAEHDYESAPVLLWLQGGPGAPSMMGLFTEVGPFFVANDSRSLILNPYSWHKNHSLIFIDNTVGTGFSYTSNDLGYAKNESDVGHDLYSAMVQFFTLFPELQKNNFFIAGESYAGKYIPALGHTIHTNNPNASLKINLKGMAIGNGYVDPARMIRYSDLVYQWGLFDNATWQAMHQLEDSILKLIAAEEFAAANDVYNTMVEVYQNVTQAGIHNILKGPDEDKTYYSSFLEIPSVRSAIHVGNQNFTEPGGESYLHLVADVMQSVSPWVEVLLNSGYRVVFYNGQLDYICAYALTVKMVEALKFNAAEEYKTAKRKIWYVNDRVAGYTKTAGNMTEMMIRNAGHMVPADQPAVAFQLIYQITRNIL